MSIQEICWLSAAAGWLMAWLVFWIMGKLNIDAKQEKAMRVMALEELEKIMTEIHTEIREREKK